MKENSISEGTMSSRTYEVLETIVREKVQEFIQGLLEEEVVDGIYVKAGLEKDKAALLVLIGALRNGRKVLLACESGYRESKESWQGLLRDLRGRDLRLGRLTIVDGNLGIWAALGEMHPEGQEQRCWNHKIGNVLDALPKRVQSETREYLCKIPYAESQKECERLRDAFIFRYQKDYSKATQKLQADWERMVTFQLLHPIGRNTGIRIWEKRLQPGQE